MKKIRVLIADDHQVLLDGLVMMLKDLEQIELVSTTSNGEEVLKQMDTYCVDVLLMDIRMPIKDGYETAKIVIEKYPETKVLMLSMHSEKIYIEKMYALGVDGYLLKTAGKTEIIEAIEKVHRGEKYFCKDITLAILDNSIVASNVLSGHLTKREKEILLLIFTGLTNNEIAEKLFLSADTIKTHRKNMMRKLDIKNTAGLVKYAVENFS
jgi:two-component system, NarL family, nitrate/nitrite response regulator NarL